MKVSQEADFRFLNREGSCIRQLKATIPKLSHLKEWLWDILNTDLDLQ